jgi:diaminopimelate epimerase
MKASSKFRLSKTFSLLSGDVRLIAVLAAKYGNGLVSVSHQHVEKGSYQQARTYVLRLIDSGDLVDVEVYVDSLDNVIETERVVVIARKQVEMPKPDFTYARSTLYAHTEAARKWVERNFMPDRSYTGNAHLVDVEYIKGIERSIKADGLSILIP